MILSGQGSTPLPGAITAYAGGSGFLSVFNTIALTLSASIPPILPTVELITAITTVPSLTLSSTTQSGTTQSGNTQSSVATELPIDADALLLPLFTNGSVSVTPTSQPDTIEITGQVNVQGNFTVVDLPISVTNTSAYGSVNATYVLFFSLAVQFISYHNDIFKLNVMLCTMLQVITVSNCVFFIIIKLLLSFFVDLFFLSQCSGCVHIQPGGTLSLTLSAEQIENLNDESMSLVLITSGSDCLEGSFSEISIAASNSEIDYGSRCITLEAQPVYTASQLTVLVTSRDRCKKDEFPKWAVAVIACSMVLIATTIVIVLYVLFRRGYLRSWWAVEDTGAKNNTDS